MNNRYLISEEVDVGISCPRCTSDSYSDLDMDSLFRCNNCFELYHFLERTTITAIFRNND